MKCDKLKEITKKYIYNGIHWNLNGLYVLDEEKLINLLKEIELFENFEQLVKTKDIIVRDGQKYDVVIADDNIFVICPIVYNEEEQSDIVKYDKSEIYANQESINTLEELRFEKL